MCVFRTVLTPSYREPLKECGVLALTVWHRLVVLFSVRVPVRAFCGCLERLVMPASERDNVLRMRWRSRLETDECNTRVEDKNQLCLSPLPRVFGRLLLFLDPDFRLASSERALLLFGFPHTRRESQVKVPIGQPSHTRDGQSVVSRHITPVRRRERDREVQLIPIVVTCLPSSSSQTPSYVLSDDHTSTLPSVVLFPLDVFVFGEK